jgi:hypothetical protein
MKYIEGGECDVRLSELESRQRSRLGCFAFWCLYSINTRCEYFGVRNRRKGDPCDP